MTLMLAAMIGLKDRDEASTLATENMFCNTCSESMFCNTCSHVSSNKLDPSNAALAAERSCPLAPAPCVSTDLFFF
jgi:hypothetical protein